MNYTFTDTICRYLNERGIIPSDIEMIETNSRDNSYIVGLKPLYISNLYLSDFEDFLRNTEHINYNNIALGSFLKKISFPSKKEYIPPTAKYREKLDLFKKVIFQDGATIILWKDGTKTVVKAHDEEVDYEKGFAMAIAKKFLGNEGNYYEAFKKFLPNSVDEDEDEK